MDEQTLTTGYQSPPSSDIPAPAPAAISVVGPAMPMPLSAAPPMPLTPNVPVISIGQPSMSSPPVAINATPMSTAEACTYFAVGLVLNFFGLFISAVVKRGITPCLLGFAFSFALYDLLIIALGRPYMYLSLITAIFLIIIFYRFHEDQQQLEGNWADFTFYLILSIPFNAVGLFFGLFQSRKKGALGAALGFFISMLLVGVGLVVAGVQLSRTSYAMYSAYCYVIGGFTLALSLALIGVVSVKIAKNDGNALGFVTFLLLSAMFGPFGVLAAVLNPATDSKFGGIFGLFCYFIILGIAFLAEGSPALLFPGIALIVAGCLLNVALVFMLIRRKAEPAAAAAATTTAPWFNAPTNPAGFTTL
ncbi:hypothetical protein PAPYR_10345 [Paratrimastix pyriformis]|uniref:Uncharacterized protein n=1 Tax=Paratrimastix pyriformis TaxID=342808 RepID=A0ABQ8U8S4_9EUKA|nr:hypothetical protein PAPYR_10345 [Paratrimastix pyriformis]|eukprot:GAFH01001933.1.p2 GENE.GAFH01001933.1~~GAFH01001933.1.p2  ORF type:complete len:362 (+),score=124.21 GAFH01001933.1:28-1113(+)